MRAGNRNSSPLTSGAKPSPQPKPAFLTERSPLPLTNWHFYFPTKEKVLVGNVFSGIQNACHPEGPFLLWEECTGQCRICLALRFHPLHRVHITLSQWQRHYVFTSGGLHRSDPVGSGTLSTVLNMYKGCVPSSPRATRPSGIQHGWASLLPLRSKPISTSLPPSSLSRSV